VKEEREGEMELPPVTSYGGRSNSHKAMKLSDAVGDEIKDDNGDEETEATTRQQMPLPRRRVLRRISSVLNKSLPTKASPTTIQLSTSS